MNTKYDKWIEKESERIDEIKDPKLKERERSKMWEVMDVDGHSSASFAVKITTVHMGIVTVMVKEGTTAMGKIVVETHNGEISSRVTFDDREFKLLYHAMLKHGAEAWRMPDD